MAELTNEEVRERYEKLSQVAQLLASAFREVPDTDYLVVAVSRGERLLESGQLQPVSASVLCTNVHWHDHKGNRIPATVGILTDFIVEAKLSPGGVFHEGCDPQSLVQHLKM